MKDEESWGGLPAERQPWEEDVRTDPLSWLHLTSEFFILFLFLSTLDLPAKRPTRLDFRLQNLQMGSEVEMI